MSDSIDLGTFPDRPLTMDELEAIDGAGDFRRTQPGLMAWGEQSPFQDADAVLAFVVVDEDWFGAFRFRDGGWVQAFREGCDADEDDGLLAMVALEEIGLA